MAFTPAIGYLATLDPFSTVVLAAWTVLFFVLAPRVAAPGRRGGRILSLLVLAILGYLEPRLAPRTIRLARRLAEFSARAAEPRDEASIAHQAVKELRATLDADAVMISLQPASNTRFATTAGARSPSRGRGPRGGGSQGMADLS